MTPKTRRTLLELGIALDAVIIATGAAYFAPADPLYVFGAFLAAVAIAAWMRDPVAGLAAAMFSVVALLLAFETLLDTKRLAIFGATAAVICVAVEVIRWSSGQQQAVVSAEAERREPASIVPYLRFLGLPLLVFVIYTNLSDIAMRNFALPSLLQPLILILGVAVWHYRDELGTSRILAQPLTFALALYALMLFCSSVWAADVQLADERIIDNVKNLAMFIIIGTLASSWRALRVTLAVLAAAASVLAVVTMHQTLTHDYTHEYFGFARIQMAHLYGSVVELRPAGPVGDPNFYAQFLLMIVPLAFFAALAESRRSRRLALFAAAAIVAAGTLLTYSRGAAVALAVMTLLTLATLKIRARQVGAFAGAAVVVLLLLPHEVMARLVTIESLVPGSGVRVDSSIMKRKLLLATAFRIFDDHPLLGVGAGNFTRYFAQYANEVGSSAVQYDEPGEHMFPHTLYLEIGSETGILGLLVFGAAAACAFVSLLRSRRELLARGDTAHAGLATGLAIALLGYLMTSIFLHGSFQRYLWLLFALIAAVRANAKQAAMEASTS